MKFGTFGALAIAVICLITETSIAAQSVWLGDVLPRDPLLESVPVETLSAEYRHLILPIASSDLMPLVQIPDDAKQAPAQISRQLNQLFVLTAIGAVLDREASFHGIKPDNDPLRVEYALQKILTTDTQRLSPSCQGAVSGSDEIRFAALKERVGQNAFRFVVNWSQEDTADPASRAILSRLRGGFRPVIYQGGPGSFPFTLVELRAGLQNAIEELSRRQTREAAITNLILENRFDKELLARMGENTVPSESDLRATLISDPDGKLAGTTFQMLELRVGTAGQCGQVEGAVKACTAAFQKEFETVFARRQTEAREELNSLLTEGKLSNDELNKRTMHARMELSRLAFDETVATIAKEGCIPGTNGFDANLSEIKFRFDPFHVLQADSMQKQRLLRLASLIQTNFTLVTSLVPNIFQTDPEGNIYYDVFQAKTGEATPEAALKDPVTTRLAARAWQEGHDLYVTQAIMERLFLKRYTLRARTDAFAIDGITGIKLTGAINKPERWIPSLFNGDNGQPRAANWFRALTVPAPAGSH